MSLMASETVLTRTGLPVRYDAPEEQEIRHADICLALSMLNRWGGWAGSWSVLNHSFFCMTLAEELGCSDRTVADAAVHDFHEAYIWDVPSPAKMVFDGYSPLEKRFARRVLEFYGLWPVEDPNLVKLIDLRALVAEAVMFDINPEFVCEQVGLLPNDEDLRLLDKVGRALYRSPNGPLGIWSTLLSRIYHANDGACEAYLAGGIVHDYTPEPEAIRHWKAGRLSR